MTWNELIPNVAWKFTSVSLGHYTDLLIFIEEFFLSINDYFSDIAIILAVIENAFGDYLLEETDTYNSGIPISAFFLLSNWITLKINRYHLHFLANNNNLNSKWCCKSLHRIQSFSNSDIEHQIVDIRNESCIFIDKIGFTKVQFCTIFLIFIPFTYLLDDKKFERLGQKIFKKHRNLRLFNWENTL